MFGTKMYELSITETYVQNWTVIQAVREVIQNGLDSDGAFSYKIVKKGEGNYTLRVDSQGVVLTPRTLLLGASSKQANEGKIGQYGEGFKLALLILLREGKQPEMLNGKHRWHPCFTYNTTFGADILAIAETPLSKAIDGLSFVIKNLTEQEIASIKESCLLMQGYIGEVIETMYGEILKDQPGKLYVGKLFVCNTQLKFGYNLKPQYLELDRDRQTVDNWDMKSVVKQLWESTGKFNTIAELLEEDVEDVSLFEYDSSDLVKEACYDLFKKKHPGAVIAKSQAQLEELIERNLKVVVYQSNFASNVSSAPTYKLEQPSATKETLDELLGTWIAENKKHMRRSAIVNFATLRKRLDLWRK